MTSATYKLEQQSLRILQVVAPAMVGGLEQVVRALAAGLVRRGHVVHVLAVLDDQARDHSFLHLVQGAGVRVSPLFLKPHRYFQERRILRSLLSDLNPDVVHTHGYRPDVVDAPVARRMGLPTVTTVHGFTGGGWRNRLYERLQLAAFRRFQAVIAVSRPLVHRVESAGVDPDRVHLVRNAWRGGVRQFTREESRRTLDVPLEGFRIGWVGRLSSEKGPDVMLASLPHLADVPAFTSFLGDGSERDRLQSVARSLGVSDRVTWHGTVSDASVLFRAFDVFVLSSRTEGTPIALFEAIAADVPVIATAVGGVPDVVTSREALIIPPDDPEALAAALREVHRDAAGARNRARAAATRVAEHFGLDPWLDAYERIYLAATRQAGLETTE